MKRQIRNSFYKDYFAIDIINKDGLVVSTPIYIRPWERVPMRIKSREPHQPQGIFLDCFLTYNGNTGTPMIQIGESEGYVPTNSTLLNEEEFKFPIKTFVTVAVFNTVGALVKVVDFECHYGIDELDKIKKEAPNHIGNVRNDFVLDIKSSPENGGLSTQVLVTEDGDNTLLLNEAVAVLNSLRGIEVWISDKKMKEMFQNNVYKFLEKYEKIN